MYVYFSIVFTILVLLLVYNAYLKIKYPFWSKQPVFHFHYLHYYFKNDKHIYNNVSDMKLYKYIDIENIITIDYNREKDENRHKYIIECYFSLIKNHYLKNNISVFNPSLKYLYDILNTHYTHLSLYKSLEPIYNCKNELSYRTTVISGITSRMLTLYRPTKESNMKTLYLNYVDFLCTHIKKRKKDITPKVIYTHARDIMLKNKDKHNKNDYNTSNIFLFKREGEKQSFVPFTVYSNFVFDLKYFSIQNNNDFKHIKLEKICNGNFELLFRTMENMKKTGINILSVSLETIKNYIDNGIIHVFICHIKGEAICIYIYKNNCFYYNTKSVFELMSSYYFSHSLYDSEVLPYFFKKSCKELIDSQYIGYMNIENISMNNTIIKNMKNKYSECYKYMNNFYLYNYILNPIKSRDLFMIL